MAPSNKINSAVTADSLLSIGAGEKQTAHLAPPPAQRLGALRDAQNGSHRFSGYHDVIGAHRQPDAPGGVQGGAQAGLGVQGQVTSSPG